MLIDPKRYNNLLAARGAGAWGRLDYDGRYTNLRVLNVRQNDSNLRFYFDAGREQVVTGVRYAPIRANPFLMVPGYGYRITSHIEFVKPVPDDIMVLVIPNRMLAENGLQIISAPLVPGFKGLVEFTCMTICALSIEDMIAVGHLMFFTIDDPVATVAPLVEEEEPGETVEEPAATETEPETTTEEPAATEVGSNEDAQVDATLSAELNAAAAMAAARAKKGKSKPAATKAKPKTKAKPAANKTKPKAKVKPVATKAKPKTAKAKPSTSKVKAKL